MVAIVRLPESEYRNQKLILGTEKSKGNSQELTFIKFCCIISLK